MVSGLYLSELYEFSHVLLRSFLVHTSFILGSVFQCSFPTALISSRSWVNWIRRSNYIAWLSLVYLFVQRSWFCVVVSSILATTVGTGRSAWYAVALLRHIFCASDISCGGCTWVLLCRCLSHLGTVRTHGQYDFAGVRDRSNTTNSDQTWRKSCGLLFT